MKKISVVIPFHFMDDWQFFLTRCLESIEKQSFKDYEILLIKHSTMPVTSNRVIESAQGGLIKVLYMDDYLAHGNALQEIVDNIGDAQWLVTGCTHDKGDGRQSNYHSPSYNEKIYTGANTIGSPSVLTMKKEGLLLFDTNLSWVLDCDLYKRLHDMYGPPKILDTPNVTIGQHKGQTSSIMSENLKAEEVNYLIQKYE